MRDYNKFIGYIYKTTNLINGKIYVGQSTYLTEWKLINYIGSGSIFTKAVKKYGVESFNKEIIEFVSGSQIDLDNREIFWIESTNSRDKNIGYNIKFGGSRGKQAETTKKKLSDIHKNSGRYNGDKNPLRLAGGHTQKTKDYIGTIKSFCVLQFSFDGELISKYKNTHSLPPPFLQVAVYRCCNGISASHANYLFLYEKDFTKKLLAERLLRIRNTRKSDGTTKKSVIKLNCNFEEIDRFLSVRDCARRDNVSSRFILRTRLESGEILNGYYYRYAA